MNGQAEGVSRASSPELIAYGGQPWELALEGKSVGPARRGCEASLRPEGRAAQMMMRVVLLGWMGEEKVGEAGPAIPQ